MSVSKKTALNSAVTTINGSLEKQSYRSAWTVVSMLWSLSSLCQSYALWSFQGVVWLCMYNAEGRKTPWPAWSQTPQQFIFEKMHFHHGHRLITWQDEGCLKWNMDRFDRCFYRIFYWIYLHAMHEREEQSWIIVHGCMGELSHLMCSYTFEGIKIFSFPKTAIKIKHYVLLLEYANIIKDTLVFIFFIDSLKVDFPLYKAYIYKCNIVTDDVRTINYAYCH